MAVAFDTSWQWVLSPDDTAELQKCFWRQAMLWLSKPMPNAWVATDQADYDARRLADGAAVIEVTAGVEDSQGTPAKQCARAGEPGQPRRPTNAGVATAPGRHPAPAGCRCWRRGNTH